MPLSRRTLLRAGLVAIGGGFGYWLHRDFLRSSSPGMPPVPEGTGTGPGARKGLVIGPCRVRGEAGRPDEYFLSILDLDSPGHEPRLTPLAFHPHGVSPLPGDPGRAILFEKQGPGCCEVDLRADKILRTVTTTDDRWFYGHGAWSLDGSVVYATETVLEDDSGVIVVRDGETFEIQGRFPTHGARPHDCRFLEGGRILAITNGGGKLGGVAPSVTYVDVQTEQLVERIEFENPRINAGHLMLTIEGGLAVVSAPRHGLSEREPGAIGLRPAGGEFRTMTEPSEVTSRMLGETLSVAIHEESGVVGSTNPAGNLVTFWDLQTQKFLRSLDLPRPTGITLTLDRKYFVICYGEQASSLMIEVENLERFPAGDIEYAFLTGSHLITHQIPGV